MYRRAGIETELVSRVDQSVLRWIGHVERMDEYHMARRVFIEDVSGGQVWGRLRLGWIDGWHEDGLGQQRDDSAAQQCAKDRREWRVLMHMNMIEFNAFIFGQPFHALVDYHLERGGMPLHDVVGLNCKRGATCLCGQSAYTLSGHIGKVVALHAEGCKVESWLLLSCTDLCYASGAQGLLPMRVGGVTS